MQRRSEIAAIERNIETLPVCKLNMKTILLFTCIVTLITTTGCFFPGRGGGHWHDRGEVIVAPSAVAVQAPEVIVAPPLVEVQAPEVVVR
jgi:Ser-tRNA(Ala) deacylase AlaX